MAKDYELTFNIPAWNAMIKDIVNTDGIARMRRVANGCNAQIEGEDGYLVSTEGDEPLSKHSYRATVITANAEAMRDNAKHNTLVHNFSKAGGD